MPALASVDNTAVVPARPTLNGLPSELRLEIFSYLLDAEVVEKIEASPASTAPSSCAVWDHDDDKYFGPRKVYQFTPSVLAASKKFNAEGRQVFWDANRFVRVKYHIREFRTMGRLLELPVIAHVTGSYMRGHCLEVEVGWSFPKRPEYDVLVICLRDWLKLCQILRYFGMSDFPPAPFVASARGEPFSFSCPELMLGSIEIQVAAKTGPGLRTLHPQEQDDILNGLKCVQAGGYNFTITGVGNEARVRNLKLEISPSIVFPAPFVLDYNQLVRIMKRHADDLLITGDSAAAIARYRHLREIIHSADCNTILKMKDVSHAAADAAEPFMWTQHRFFFDVRLSILANDLYERRVQHRPGYLSPLDDAEYIMTPRVRSWYHHLLVLMGIQRSAGSDLALSRQLEDAQEYLQMLENRTVFDEYVACDIQVLRDFITAVMEYGLESLRVGDGEAEAKSTPLSNATPRQFQTKSTDASDQGNKNVPPSLSVVMEGLSTWQMPRRIFDAWETGEIELPSEVENFVGWEDRGHLRQLSKDDEPELHRAQAERGLALTKLG